MAINETAVWRIRIAGSDTNGAGYDSAISGAGTDYSQQDAPQLSLTDAVGIGTTTLTSVTGGFTSAMIGNAIRISAGTGATVGYYFITGRTDTNTVTIDRSPGTGTGWTAKVGGAAATIYRTLNNANATGDKVVAGNTVYIRGAGSDSPSSADYTFTSFATPVSGTTTSGMVKVIGENGRPRLLGNGLIFYLSAYVHFENLYLTANSNSNGTLGLLHTSGPCIIKNCVLDTANQTSMSGIVTTAGAFVFDTEIYGGTTTPTLSANSYGILVGGWNTTIVGCNIHHCRNNGIHQNTATAACTVVNNKINKNAGHGIYIQQNATVISTISGNTIDANLLDGIHVLTSAALSFTAILNNIISNHTVSARYGINVAAGTATVNDKLAIVNYNDLYNNTTARNNISAGVNDQALDPSYTNATNGDYSIGTALKALGFPGFLRNSAAIESTGTTSYVDIGAAQRQEPAGGSGGGSLNLGGLGQTGIGIF